MTPEELIENFSYLTDWEDKYRYLIELGEQLPPMSDSEKTAINKVDGCMSQVWISYTMKDGQYYFNMDSDAHIVRGLEAILWILVNGKTSDEISKINIDDIFHQLGLSEHLSPTRRNGFIGMIKKIKKIIEE
ncbi:MAG: SufE family protein [Alphaproteobacteria bacterium]|nr:SufE family protein [Alphaproteobacteria bacterium]